MFCGLIQACPEMSQHFLPFRSSGRLDSLLHLTRGAHSQAQQARKGSGNTHFRLTSAANTSFRSPDLARLTQIPPFRYNPRTSNRIAAKIPGWSIDLRGLKILTSAV